MTIENIAQPRPNPRKHEPCCHGPRAPERQPKAIEKDNCGGGLKLLALREAGHRRARQGLPT